MNHDPQGLAPHVIWQMLLLLFLLLLETVLIWHPMFDLSIPWYYPSFSHCSFEMFRVADCTLWSLSSSVIRDLAGNGRKYRFVAKPCWRLLQTCLQSNVCKLTIKSKLTSHYTVNNFLRRIRYPLINCCIGDFNARSCCMTKMQRIAYIRCYKLPIVQRSSPNKINHEMARITLFDPVTVLLKIFDCHEACKVL